MSITTGGDADWYGQSFVSHDGVDAAKSGGVADSQSTYMQTTITGPGTIIYWWKVSSEPGFDYLKCYIDGELSRQGA